MSLTTLPYQKTHERDYNPNPLSGAVCLENTVKAVAADHHGITGDDGARHDAGSVALDGGRRQLADDPALVSDANGLGIAVVDGGTNASARPERRVSAGGR